MTREPEHVLRELLVASARWEAEGVVSLELVDPSGRALPSWQPGAHIDLHLPSGLVRQYSLCGDPADIGTYHVAVLREVAGRGGSAEVHDTQLLGRTLGVGGPRNHFELVDASRYVFIAGGIGITPILSMVRAADATNSVWELHYGGRTRRSMAYLGTLEKFLGGKLTVIPQDEMGHPDLASILSFGTDDDAEIYCCGPAPLIAAVEARCEEIGKTTSLHIEHFGRGVGDEIPVTGSAFEIVLAETGLTLQVPPDRSILDVAREVIPDLPFSCQEGVCGTCETDVLEGVPEHHDLILTPEEREEGATMMICVGRCQGPRLVLKL